MADEATSLVRCGTHGDRTPAVVCCHHLAAKYEAVGFVENSTDPEDLQAWCDACEQVFLAEGGLTEAFRRFNDLRVVCDFCYATMRNRHGRFGG
jgi:hypothetical protein